MSKKLIISEEEKKYLMSLYSNKGIIKEQGTPANLPWIDSKGKYQEVNSNQTQGDKGKWTPQTALEKYPCLRNLMDNPNKIYILDNGNYDYVIIRMEGKKYNLFLGDGHLFDVDAKSWTQKYLGSEELPCQENSTYAKLDLQPSKPLASNPKPYTTKYIDQLANQLQLPGKSEQEKINQIMGELNKITPKKATA